MVRILSEKSLNSTLESQSPDIDHLIASALCREPLWREEDLGKPLPDTPHAASVALPLWSHVVGYEEGNPQVLSRLSSGYPRFVIHPFAQRLFDHCRECYARSGETAIAMPSEETAHRCAAYLTAKTGCRPRIVSMDKNGIHAVLFPEAAFVAARQFWQHFGEIVSSRRAQAFLEDRGDDDTGLEAKQKIRDRISGLTGVKSDAVYLYPSGMSALTEALAMMQAQRPGAKNVQLGFPYVDVYKIQTVWGPGAHFFPHPNDMSLDALEVLLETETVSGVITEFPGNPLLDGAHIPRLSALLRKHKVPLIVDDTAGTFYNLKLLPYVDALVTSLTKYFSGTGDVMAGSLVLNPESPHLDAFGYFLNTNHQDLLWGEDAIALEYNSRTFIPRLQRINNTAMKLCAYLKSHPYVAEVYYPQFRIPGAYELVRQPDGGYGGLFSLLFKEAHQRAPIFYDTLRVSKGPSLGNNFSLACPYTLLAHYQELEWAESIGISRYLIRVSVGLEAFEELQERFDIALNTVC